jgi:hypothetical protein
LGNEKGPAAPCLTGMMETHTERAATIENRLGGTIIIAFGSGAAV